MLLTKTLIFHSGFLYIVATQNIQIVSHSMQILVIKTFLE